MSLKLVYWIVAAIDPNNAGFRVRTQPLAAALRETGLALELMALNDLPGKLSEIAAKAQVVIIAKPADSCTYLCIKYLQSKGVRVIADLFDNYFSWSPSLYRRQVHWSWLRATSNVDGILVSTEFLGNTIETVLASPAVCVGDPAPELQRRQVEERQLKWDHPRDVIECLWFGIQGNPYFPAGLDDVSSWCRTLAALQDQLTGRCLRVTLCTNRVAAVESVLIQLRQHGIEGRFTDWSEETCHRLLDQAHLVIIPTNLAGFSLSKTHNRCSDALVRNCLVLTSPNGPYGDIPGAVFSDIPACVAMLAADKDVVETAISRSVEYLRNHYSVKESAERILDAIASVMARPPQPVSPAGTRVLLVGRTNGKTVKFSRELKYVSASFKGSGLELNFDILYLGNVNDPTTLDLQLSQAGWDAVLKALQKNANVDWLSSGASTSCTLGEWSISFNAETMQCRIVAADLVPAVLSIERIRPIAHASPAMIEEWFNENIGFLAVLLQRLGLNELELAADEPGGWPTYAELAAPSLARREAELRGLWLSHQGNELAMGRRTEMAA